MCPPTRLFAPARKSGIADSATTRRSISWKRDNGGGIGESTYLRRRLMQTAPDVQPCPGISALPERSQVARLRVEQGTFAIPDGVDDNKVTVGAVETQSPVALP